MAFTWYTIKDATGTVHTFGTQIKGGLESTGVWLRALPLGGATPYKNLSVDATGALVQNSPGSLYAIVITNNGNDASPPSMAEVYVKLYDKASAPTVGTDVPVWTIPVPADGEPYMMSLPVALAFQNGIGIAATLNPADADATDPGANIVIANLLIQA